MVKRSRNWFNQHSRDPYVRQAQQMGYRSRAAYKLIEIQKKNTLIRPGVTVLELGAAPGGWSQLLAKWVGSKGRVFAIDLLPMEALPGVEYYQADVFDDAFLEPFTAQYSQMIDVVCSDMAPNMTGHKSVDIPRVLALGDMSVQLATKICCIKDIG